MTPRKRVYLQGTTGEFYSLFILANSTGMSQFENLPFENVSRIFESFGKSLTKSRNRSDLNIEPCGTPYVTDK